MTNYKIYCLTNSITNKKYIGLTKRNLSDRFRNGYGYSSAKKIYNAIKEYGWESFKHEILFVTTDVNIASEKEKEFIKLYDTVNNGYNSQSGGLKGYSNPMDDESKKNNSKAHLGKHCSKKTEFKKGQKPINHKKVLCIELNKKFYSMEEAQRKLNISNSIPV